MVDDGLSSAGVAVNDNSSGVESEAPRPNAGIASTASHRQSGGRWDASARRSTALPELMETTTTRHRGHEIFTCHGLVPYHSCSSLASLSARSDNSRARGMLHFRRGIGGGLERKAGISSRERDLSRVHSGRTTDRSEVGRAANQAAWLL
jgi:hypothetical protein